MAFVISLRTGLYATLLRSLTLEIEFLKYDYTTFINKHNTSPKIAFDQ